jgi:hypothetical protein
MKMTTAYLGNLKISLLLEMQTTVTTRMNMMPMGTEEARKAAVPRMAMERRTNQTATTTTTTTTMAPVKRTKTAAKRPAMASQRSSIAASFVDNPNKITAVHTSNLSPEALVLWFTRLSTPLLRTSPVCWLQHSPK